MLDEISDFLTGGGGKSARFDTIGDTIVGTVVDAKVTQQTEFGTDEPKFWPNGDPMNQIVITLATDDRDPTDPEDDGHRNLYVKGSKKPESKSMTAALIAALRNAGATNLERGGTLACKYVSDGTPPKPGFNPPKQYQMQYRAPALDTGTELATDTPGEEASGDLF